MKTKRICLLLMLSILLLTSCDPFPVKKPMDPEPETETIKEIILDDKSVLLQNGTNHITIQDPADKILCTFALYDPEVYPSYENASYRIQSAFDSSRDLINIGDKGIVESVLDREGIELELFYISDNIRFFYVSSPNYPDVEDSSKAFYEQTIQNQAQAFETILDYESHLLFGQDYVDADENGYFSVYLVNYGVDPFLAGFVYASETRNRDIFYLNTYCYEATTAMGYEEEYYSTILLSIFAHELFHYLNMQINQNSIYANLFMVEGMATFAASLVEKHLGIENNYGNLFFENSYLYHPMAHGYNSYTTRGDYAVGCDFWSYIWDVYGEDKFMAMLPYSDLSKAIEENLGISFKEVYKTFLLSVLGSVGQPVDGYDTFPDAEFFKLTDCWEMLCALYLTLDYHPEDPVWYVGGETDQVAMEIAPMGYDVKVWYDNPDELVVEADPGVEVYAFTISKYYFDVLRDTYKYF